MKTTTIIKNDFGFYLQCDYDPRIVELCRQVPGREWNSTSKTWSFPFDSEFELFRLFGDEQVRWVGCTPHPSADDLTSDYNDEPIPFTVTEPWRHQRIVFNFAFPRGRAFLRCGMGTGKSKMAIDLAMNWHCTKVLVLCPLAVVNVWPNQLRAHAPVGAHCMVLNHGESVEQKATTLAWALRDWQDRNPMQPCWFVCNYESAWREPLAQKLLDEDWDLVILDESQRTKAVPRYSRGLVTSGKLAAFTSDLARRAQHRLCLSGTPGQNPLEIFSQFRFLDRSVFGDNFYRFRDRYAEMGGYEDKQFKRLRPDTDFQQRYYSFAINVSESVLDLPDAVHESREFSLGPAGRRVYDEVKRDLKAKLESGELTPANGAVAFLRLQQVTSGIAKADDGHIEECDNGKLRALAELLDDLDPAEKVVIFCQFREDLRRIRAVVESADRRYGEISGDSKYGLNAGGQFNTGCDVVACQLQAGSVGIDLTAARYCVYFSPGMSLINYEQSLKRIHRPGQTRPVTYVHLIAQNTIDDTLYRALNDKRDLIEATIGEITV